MSTPTTTPAWLTTAQRKRQIRASLIATASDALAAFVSEKNLTAAFLDETAALDLPQLTQKLQDGSLQAVTVTWAFIRKAIAAHELSNCLTEILFSDAIHRAAMLDADAASGKPMGALHGVPVTLKDQFDVQGLDSTLGYVGRAFRPAQRDCALVGILRGMGAVVLCKSNVPQSIMWCETENPLWGRTDNPHNAEFNPGGSSGGEAVLLSQDGSCVGWGTDIGGSVRIPAHVMGVCGLKPSHGRLPYQDVSVSTEGQEHVPSVIGPMARSVETLELVTRAVIDAEPWRLDPKCIPLPWRQNVYKGVQSRALKFGLLVDDGVVKVHPPIERVLNETAIKLQAAGHEVVPWNAEKLHAECIEIMDLFYTVDGCEDLKRDVQAAGEPYIPRVQALIDSSEPVSVYDYWQLVKRRDAARKKYLDKWEYTRGTSGRPVDFLITPVMPHCAVPHGKCRWVGYTKIWNFLDYSAIVFPAGKVSKDVDLRAADLPPYEARNENDEWNWKLYDPESTDGSKVNIQLVGRRLEEEKVLGVAKLVDELMKASYS